MKQAFKTLPFIIVLTGLSIAVFAQKDKDVANQIIGRWDVVLEMKASKFSNEDLKLVKDRAKVKIGNSNIALYNFNADGSFHLTSIRDYSLSDEDGTYVLNEDKMKISRTVCNPRHLKVKKRTKLKQIKVEILYVDKSFLVLKSKGVISYMHKIG